MILRTEEVSEVVITVDVPVTRRKNMTFVTDLEGNQLWSGLYFNDALAFVADSNINKVVLAAGTGRYQLVYERPLTQKELVLWLGQPPHY